MRNGRLSSYEFVKQWSTGGHHMNLVPAFVHELCLSAKKTQGKRYGDDVYER